MTGQSCGFKMRSASANNCLISRRSSCLTLVSVVPFRFELIVSSSCCTSVNSRIGVVEIIRYSPKSKGCKSSVKVQEPGVSGNGTAVLQSSLYGVAGTQTPPAFSEVRILGLVAHSRILRASRRTLPPCERNAAEATVLGARDTGRWRIDWQRTNRSSGPSGFGAAIGTHHWASHCIGFGTLKRGNTA
jgi:hypothetical protein